MAAVVTLALVLPVAASSAAEDEDNDDADPSAISSSAAAPAPELDPIVIDADAAREAVLIERGFDTPDDVAAFGETILAEPAWRGFESTGEMIGHGVGAQLRRQGGRDDFATLSIRGAPSSQLRILLDGIALGRAADAVVNLADLPLDTVDRIEVYRGFAPVGLTPASAAGVINIVTRDPSQATASAAAGGGSFGTAKANAGGAAPLLGGHASAFASYRHTEGDFHYVDDNGTLENAADDSIRERANNDSDTVESLLRWRRDTPWDGRLTMRNHVFWKEEGVPGLARFAPPDARLETVRDTAAFAFGSRDNRWSVEEGVTWEKRELTDYGTSDNDATTTASSTIARWARPVGESHWLSGSADLTWEGFEQRRTAVVAPEEEADRTSLAFGAGDDWTIPWIDDTTLTLQVRHQQLWNDAEAPRRDTSDHSTDPRVGLRWEALEGLVVKSNFSTYFRPPTFDELYGTDGFTTGNPELQPEDGLAYDAGFEWKGPIGRLGEFAVGYSWFGSDIDDVILVILTFDRTAKAVNAQKARIRGHESRIEWRGPAGFALSGNYTYQDAENRSDAPALHGKDLPGIPPHEAWFRLSWARGPVAFAYDVEVSGEHYTDSENVAPELPTRTVHGVSIVIGPFWKGWRLTLEGDNLGDSLVPDEIGFPLPGRTLHATLSWSAPARGDDDHAR